MNPVVKLIKHITNISILFSCSLLILGCNIGELEKKINRGKIHLIFDSNDNERTITPQNDQISIVSYLYKALGPDDIIIEGSMDISNEFILEALTPGDWTIEISGLNSNNQVIVFGSTNITVSASQTSSSSITLQHLLGEGTLNISISWPEEVSVDNVVFELRTDSTEYTEELELNGATANFNKSLMTGSYSILVKLLKNGQNISPPSLTSAIIYKDMISSENIEYTASEMTGIVSAPNIDLSSGIYTEGKRVYLSCPTEGAVLRYTTDGTNPTRNTGNIYSGYLYISQTSTLKVIAYRDGWVNSNIVSRNYEITGTVATPIISHNSGSYSSNFSLSLYCSTPGATIIYTLDGSEPSSSNGEIYSGPIPVSSTTIIKTIATLNKWRDSNITSNYYYISGYLYFFNGVQELEYPAPPEGILSMANSSYGLYALSPSKKIYLYDGISWRLDDRSSRLTDFTSIAVVSDVLYGLDSSGTVYSRDLGYWRLYENANSDLKQITGGDNSLFALTKTNKIKVLDASWNIYDDETPTNTICISAINGFSVALDNTGTLYKRDNSGVWVENNYQPEITATCVELTSNGYFLYANE